MTEEILKGEVHVLAGMVDYQSGSIVSRTLVRKSTGSVTLFAFDEGQKLSEHSTPHEALVLGIEGELMVDLAGVPHRLGSGDVLLMPADVPHAVEAQSQSKMVLLMVRE